MRKDIESIFRIDFEPFFEETFDELLPNFFEENCNENHKNNYSHDLDDYKKWYDSIKESIDYELEKLTLIKIMQDNEDDNVNDLNLIEELMEFLYHQEDKNEESFQDDIYDPDYIFFDN